MVQQARQALQKAREDGVDLGEIQFPPGGLDLAPGDLEGNVECTLTATVLRKIFARDERRRKNYRLVSRPDGIEVGEKRTDWNVRSGRRRAAGGFPNRPSL